MYPLNFGNPTVDKINWVLGMGSTSMLAFEADILDANNNKIFIYNTKPTNSMDIIDPFATFSEPKLLNPSACANAFKVNGDLSTNTFFAEYFTGTFYTLVEVMSSIQVDNIPAGIYNTLGVTFIENRSRILPDRLKWMKTTPHFPNIVIVKSNGFLHLIRLENANDLVL